MADLVTSHVITDGPRNYIIHLTNVSDGTGETDVHKIVIANLRTDDGQVPTKLNVKEVQWSIQGFNYVSLNWDITAPNTIALLANGNGYFEWGTLGFLSDPDPTGGTGDIMLTTSGNVGTASYDITLYVTMS